MDVFLFLLLVSDGVCGHLELTAVSLGPHLAIWTSLHLDNIF